MQEFIKKSLTTDSVFVEQNVIDNPEKLRKYVYKGASRISSIEPNLTKLARLFINENIDDTRCKAFFDSDIILSDDSNKILQYFNAENFCLAINSVARWSDELWAFAEDRFVNHWERCVPEICAPIDLYAFIGKYPLTPFGVHYDTEDSFLFNLGPGTKTVFAWSRADEGRAMNFMGANDLFNSQEAKSSGAREYAMSPGDGLYIPEGVYHVLTSNTFTVMLGLAPYHFDKSAFLSKLYGSFAITKSESAREDCLYVKDHEKKIKLLSEVHEFFSHKLLISNATDLDSLRCRSNAHQIEPTMMRCVGNIGDDDKFKLFHPNAVQIFRDGKDIYVYCRGHEMKVSNSKVAIELLVRIASAEEISLKKICVEGASSELIDFAREILESLYKYGGIVRA